MKMSLPHYAMCSLQECVERQANKQVSVFECMDARAPIHQRVMDPALAVTKYRRSAAGSERSYPCRALEQLEMSVNHLLELLLTRRTRPDDAKQSLLDTVNFVEDRLRAVQVDLVVSQTCSKRLQRRMARCQILILYLMVDCPHYETKLGRSALDAALSNYWASGGKADACEGSEEWDDEMLALSTLVQLNSFLQQNQLDATTESAERSSGFQELYTLYRRHGSASMRQSAYPLFQWALRLAADVHLGLWHVVLRCLRQKEMSFGMLARCCLAKSVSYLQYMALKTYNASFAKADAVPIQNLVRLLQFTNNSGTNDTTNGSSEILWHGIGAIPAETDHAEAVARTAAACLTFCVGLGLPPSNDGSSIVFKSAPLLNLSDGSLARNDTFVVGVDSVDSDTNRMKVPSMTNMHTLLFPE